ncbi:creatininase family protein [Mesorhizobium sp. Cs1321R2N1]|uniref:creatininase family protein n=1 Tax=Mesorhizobium sp. Cs1321R2N1 TaxID=3015174 RepID=UPI00301D3683
MTRQIERLRPHQIAEALSERSLIYLPLGTIEWHCHHLPVGLDALTAHGLCLRAADKTGGLVWPPLYYGTGGDHAGFPWTVMMPDETAIRPLLLHTLHRLNQLGVGTVVLFSGHFANEQLAMIDGIASDWNAIGKGPKVIPLAVNRARIENFEPDHAGLFETTLLSGLMPETVDRERLSSGDEGGLDRFDPKSPLWGIVGADPRRLPPVAPNELVDGVANWLAAAKPQRAG